MGGLSFNLANKVFIVTGGSRGIGFEIAKQLLAEKAKVVICARKAGQILRENKKGKIVNISSIAARRAAPAMGVTAWPKPASR